MNLSPFASEEVFQEFCFLCTSGYREKDNLEIIYS